MSLLRLFDTRLILHSGRTNNRASGLVYASAVRFLLRSSYDSNVRFSDFSPVPFRPQCADSGRSAGSASFVCYWEIAFILFRLQSALNRHLLQCLGGRLCAGNSPSLLLVHTPKLALLNYLHNHTPSSHVSIQEPLHTSLYTELVLTYKNVQISS